MIRRVLVSAINYDHPQKGMVQAFAERFPHNVREYDYLERQRGGKTLEEINNDFLDFAKEYRPDLIFMQLQESDVLKPNTLRNVRELLPKTVLTHWMGDCRNQIADYTAAVSRVTHLSLLSNVGQIPYYEHYSGQGRTHYLQIGLDWEEDVLGIPAWEPPFRVPDVVFVGGYYPESFPDGTFERLSTVRAIQAAGIDIGVVSPSPWPTIVNYLGRCTVKQQHHVWKRAKVCVNVNHFNHIERYYSDRQIISMASGRPLACWKVPGLEKEFQDGVHCLFFSSPAEAVEKVKMLLSDPALADRIGAAGKREVCENHTWAARLRQVLPELDRIHDSL